MSSFYQALPSENLWGDNFIIWKTSILKEVINDIGSVVWEESEAKARKENSLLEGIKRKHPLLTSATLEKLWKDGKKSAILQKTCEHILLFSRKLEKK